MDEESGNAMAAVTTAVVEAILEPLRPAMIAMRAEVEVGVFPAQSTPCLCRSTVFAVLLPCSERSACTSPQQIYLINCLLSVCTRGWNRC